MKPAQVDSIAIALISAAALGVLAWSGHIPDSNTTEIKKQDRLPVACQEATK